MKKSHGSYKLPEYRVWQTMIQRCHNPNARRFYLYGARGISVCAEWRESFPAFMTDMGPRPSSKHSLDRINNDGPYCKDNCRWATADIQSRNRRSNTLLELDGEKRLMCDWSRITGISAALICNRISLGWSIKKTLTTPPDKSMYRHGLTNSIAAMARKAGMHRNYVYARMKRGMSLEEALSMPVRRRN